jgi:hypothetical protein
MAVDMSGIQGGMDVYGSDDEKVGTVQGVQTTLIGGSGLDTGGVSGVEAGTTPNTYLVVEQKGLFGRGGRTLYIPSTQVAGVDGDNGVRLYCTGDACGEQFNERPPGLE